MNNNILHNVYLALGSNLGNREENINTAIKNINNRIGEVISLSSFYKTDPVGFDSQNYFLNAACRIQTILSPFELLHIIESIEIEMGRIEKSKDKQYKDRIIDIDILLYDDLITETESLVLPHPHLHEREFVILPLQEIAENLIHPVLNKTIKKIATDLHKI